MGLVLRPRLLALVLIGALVAGCGDRIAPGSAVDRTALEATGAAVDPDTIPQPVPNGKPMPAAEDAAGIPPYPGATVHVRNPRPRRYRVIQAFTPDSWEQVAAFYEESLPGWKVTKARDMVIFRKEPGDQASVTVSLWLYEDLPPDAAQVLRDARTAIGAAWR